jgi:hypothetical protein
MIVPFPPELEKKIIEAAMKKNVDPSSLVVSIVAKELRDESALAPVNGAELDEDSDPEALNRAVAAIINRTPEQIKAAQERAIREFRPKDEFPPDVSPADAAEDVLEKVFEEERQVIWQEKQKRRV